MRLLSEGSSIKDFAAAVEGSVVLCRSLLSLAHALRDDAVESDRRQKHRRTCEDREHDRRHMPPAGRLSHDLFDRAVVEPRH